MADIILENYWSKSDAFLLPLTGLKKTEEFIVKSYLFWRNYSIENYELVISFEYDDYEDFMKYCREEVFSILDKNTLLMENYDVQGRAIFILDMSEWAFDINMFLCGKYSKYTKEAKTQVDRYHRTKNTIKCSIYSVMYPNEPQNFLGGKTAIEEVCEQYGWDMTDMNKIGEVGTLYTPSEETLLTDIEELC